MAPPNKRKRAVRPSAKLEEEISKSHMRLKAMIIKRINMLRGDDDDILPEPINVSFLQNESQNTKNQTHRSVKELLNEDDTSTNFSPSKKKRRTSIKLLKWVEPKDYEPTGEAEVSVNAKKSKIWKGGMNKKTDSYAMKHAEEIRAGLSAEHPSFSKLMLHSHVVHGFWLGLSKRFTDEHLPKYDCEIMLVDEEGNGCKTKYLFYKTGLSAGWREFAITRGLCVGDVCVFHLINQKTLLFKVYIVREKMGEVDEALNGRAFQRQRISDQAEKITNRKRSPLLLEENIEPCCDAGSGREVVGGLHLSVTSISFKEMKEFEKFRIIVDDLVMDSNFTVDVRKKYHRLCSTQGVFLHEKLCKGVNCYLVLWIISEVVKISDEIRACGEVCASYDDLCLWDRTLKWFKLLGMNISFLCERLSNLIGIASEPDVTNDSRFEELILMRKKIDSELKAVIQASARKQERIKEIVDAPW